MMLMALKLEGLHLWKVIKLQIWQEKRKGEIVARVGQRSHHHQGQVFSALPVSVVNDDRSVI